MSARLINLDYTTHFAQFSIDSESDLNSLPKINTAGTDDLNTVSGVSQGSMAYCVDGTDYILNGSNKWVKYTPVDSSVSSYNKVLGSFSYNFHMKTNISITESEGIYFGSATCVGAQAYEYIYKVADMIAKKNNESIDNVLKNGLVKKTYGAIQWRRCDGNVFPFFNIIITSVSYNQEYTDPLGATVSIQFCSTVPLSNIETTSTSTVPIAISGGTTTCYNFGGIVTVVQW